MDGFIPTILWKVLGILYTFSIRENPMVSDWDSEKPSVSEQILR